MKNVKKELKIMKNDLKELKLDIRNTMRNKKYAGNKQYDFILYKNNYRYLNIAYAMLRHGWFQNKDITCFINEVLNNKGEKRFDTVLLLKDKIIKVESFTRPENILNISNIEDLYEKLKEEFSNKLEGKAS